MADYTKTTNFTAKDALTTGDPLKVIKGSYFDTEFDNIATAIATKYDSDDLASQAQAEALSSNVVLMTPLRVSNVLEENAGMLGDIQALADPNADTLLGWDDSAGAVIGFTIGDGLETTAGGALQLPAALAGAGLTLSSGVLAVGGGNGITANADDVALTDVTAGAAQPVNISSGTFTFDLSAITTMNITELNVAEDGLVISDNGVIKVMPIDEAGVDVVESDAVQTFALTDANTMQVNTTTARTWTIPANAAVAFQIGTVIILGNNSASDLTITADTGVILESIYNTGDTTATSDVVDPGGMAVLVKVGTNEWMLSGDISDS